MRDLDIVVYGATGFTGRLVAEYLARLSAERRAAGAAPLRWALGGRNEAKLAAVRSALGTLDPEARRLELLVASSGDDAGMRRIAARTRVLLTTVGPYARYGHGVVAACVAEGADYVDITGEPDFVSAIRERHGAEAEAAGARIVSCCGFDSVPHDLGAWFTARQLPSDAPMVIEGFVEAKGRPSGGTWQTATDAMGELLKKPKGGRRPRSASGERKVKPLATKVRYEPRLKAWVAPFPSIDPVIVCRSAKALAEFGPDFRYGHYLRLGTLPKLVKAGAFVGGVFALAQTPPTRRLLQRFNPPGEGPDEAMRARSWFVVTFLGRAGGDEVRCEVSGGDPGYGETSKMIAEAALTLAEDRDRLPGPTGVLTPAVALGAPYLERLQRAGLRFELTGCRCT